MEVEIEGGVREGWLESRESGIEGKGGRREESLSMVFGRGGGRGKELEDEVVVVDDCEVGWSP